MSCSLSQKQRILSLRSRHSPCLAGSGSETKADSSLKLLLPFEPEVHLFSIVELFLSLHDKFSVIPKFQCNLMHDSLDRVYFSSSSTRTFCGFPFELDKPTGLHDVTLIVVIQVDC